MPADTVVPMSRPGRSTVHGILTSLEAHQKSLRWLADEADRDNRPGDRNRFERAIDDLEMMKDDLALTLSL